MGAPTIHVQFILAVLIGLPAAATFLTVGLAVMPKGGRDVAMSALGVLAVCLLPQAF
jgi:hypothetical protein